MRRFSTIFAKAVALIAVLKFSGCADQTQTGCPIIVGNNGTIMVYLRQPEGTYAVFISCAGQQYQLMTNYSFQTCPSPTDVAILTTLIDATCAGVQSSSSTSDPLVSSTLTYSSSGASSSSDPSSSSVTSTSQAPTVPTSSAATTTDLTTVTTTEEITTTTESSTEPVSTSTSADSS